MKIMKVIWIVLGFIALTLGVIGIFIPMLPTTPLLLLTLACFTRGSTRVCNWFLTTNIYKKHLKNFNETRALTRKAKIIILSTASCMLLLGFYFSRNIYARCVILLVIAVKYYVFLFKIKTIDEIAKETAEKE